MTSPPAAIADDERLLRRVVINDFTRTWDANLGRWMPTTAGFVIDPDGISTYRRQLIEAIGHGPAVVALGRPDAVFEVVAGDARGEQIDAVADPQPEPKDIGPAHALLTFPAEGTSAKKRRLRRFLKSALIVHGAELWPVDSPPEQG